jgi:hypothetical protein
MLQCEGMVCGDGGWSFPSCHSTLPPRALDCECTAREAASLWISTTSRCRHRTGHQCLLTHSFCPLSTTHPQRFSFDPALDALQGRWSSSASLPEARTDAAIASVQLPNNQAYVFVAGGISANGAEDNTTTTSLLQYTVSSNSWRAGPTLPEGRIGAAAAAVAIGDDFLVFLIGGSIPGAEGCPDVSTLVYVLPHPLSHFVQASQQCCCFPMATPPPRSTTQKNVWPALSIAQHRTPIGAFADVHSLCFCFACKRT